MLKNDKRSAVFAVLGAILVLIAIVGLIRLTGLNKNKKEKGGKIIRIIKTKVYIQL